MKRHLALALVCGVVACGVAPEEAPPAERLGVGRLGVIGGLVAPSPELDHTAALVRLERETGVPHLVCTATLIGPETALTAKHCIRLASVAALLGQGIALAIGGDLATAQLVPVVATDAPEAGPEPGALGNGYDVAVVHIEAPVDVRLATPRPFDAARLRGALVTLGYGMSSVWSLPDGLRRIGRETVVATTGRVYEVLYGDFESYLEVELTGASTSENYLARVQADPELADIDALLETYDGTRLIPEHEVITRTLDGDTRSCRGDSGGPLLRVDAHGDWEVYGVLSGGPSSLRAECDFGQVYATLGPETWPFIAASLDWADPCGNVDADGRCAGPVAEHCETDLTANTRRLVRNDCSASGQVCRVMDSTAGCGSPEAP